MVDNGVMYHGVEVVVFEIVDNRFGFIGHTDSYEGYERYATENRSRILYETFDILDNGKGRFILNLGTE